MGNAPYLDILVSSEDGERVLALQVKTTEHALRDRGRGAQRKQHHLEFPLGHKAAKLNRPNVLFAFVDLAILSSNSQPTVYLVPSTEVFKFCAPWVDQVPMVRFHPTLDWMEPYREAWGRVAAVVGEPPVAQREGSPESSGVSDADDMADDLTKWTEPTIVKVEKLEDVENILAASMNPILEETAEERAEIAPPPQDAWSKWQIGKDMPWKGRMYVRREDGVHLVLPPFDGRGIGKRER